MVRSESSGMTTSSPESGTRSASQMLGSERGEEAEIFYQTWELDRRDGKKNLTNLTSLQQLPSWAKGHVQIRTQRKLQVKSKGRREINVHPTDHRDHFSAHNKASLEKAQKKQGDKHEGLCRKFASSHHPLQ